VVVDNRPGAGGNVAGEIVAKSPPDGYTLLMGSNGILATHASLYKNMAFDPVKDFAPVTLLASQPNILVVRPSLPVKSVKELIALARSRPGQLNYASAGSGLASHLAAELFKSMTKTEMLHVPYKGGAIGAEHALGPVRADIRDRASGSAFSQVGAPAASRRDYGGAFP
jgi:tripartite-type tricarboxylate transporter receptor subunit TctC